MRYSVAILIVSDRAAKGEREDRCLPVFQSSLADSEFAIGESMVVSDESAEIQDALRRLIEQRFDVVFTCGTGGGV
jgi:molybdopterin biosynthesis enzyme MoaB